jgi:K+-sensing histidine kinase KdpD
MACPFPSATAARASPRKRSLTSSNHFIAPTNSAQSDTEHLGLGLFLVQSHVKALSGTCEIDTKHGEGTTVTVHLPRVGKPAQPADHPQLAAV